MDRPPSKWTRRDVLYLTALLELYYEEEAEANRKAKRRSPLEKLGINEADLEDDVDTGNLVQRDPDGNTIEVSSGHKSYDTEMSDAEMDAEMEKLDIDAMRRSMKGSKDNA